MSRRFEKIDNVHIIIGCKRKRQYVSRAELFHTIFLQISQRFFMPVSYSINKISYPILCRGIRYARVDMRYDVLMCVIMGSGENLVGTEEGIANGISRHK
jgi:hypothetical protein